MRCSRSSGELLDEIIGEIIDVVKVACIYKVLLFPKRKA